ncbi:MAG: DUF397 domain-containing protein [Streptosporangiaceae bacterium]
MWFKSTFSSGNGQCVECAHLRDGGMAVRDTKNRPDTVLRFTAGEWKAFLADVRSDKFD